VMTMDADMRGLFAGSSFGYKFWFSPICLHNVFFSSSSFLLFWLVVVSFFYVLFCHNINLKMCSFLLRHSCLWCFIYFVQKKIWSVIIKQNFF
jgi:hypothetical protein